MDDLQRKVNLDSRASVRWRPRYPFAAEGHRWEWTLESEAQVNWSGGTMSNHVRAAPPTGPLHATSEVPEKALRNVSTGLDGLSSAGQSMNEWM